MIHLLRHGDAEGSDGDDAAELRGGSFDALALAAGRGDVLLVGHEPDFAAIAR